MLPVGRHGLRLCNEVQNHITIDMVHRSEIGSDGAVFKNGVLDFDTMKLETHSPDFYFLSAYPVNYIPAADVDERKIPLLNTADHELVMDFDACG